MKIPAYFIIALIASLLLAWLNYSHDRALSECMIRQSPDVCYHTLR